MKQQLMDLLKQAMKDDKKMQKGCLQLVKARCDAYEKENGEYPEGASFYQLVGAEIKQAEQTLEYAIKANNDSAAAVATMKRDYLFTLMPPQLDASEVLEKVKEMVDPSLSMGENMKTIQVALAGQANGRDVANAVRVVLVNGKVGK